MTLSSIEFQRLVFRQVGELRRLTQDSPVFPEVWMELHNEPEKAIDLILTPHRRYSAGILLQRLRDRLHQVSDRSTEYSRVKDDRLSPNRVPASPWHLATTGGFVAAELTLSEILGATLPLTPWWHNYLYGQHGTGDEKNWLGMLIAALTHHDFDDLQQLLATDSHEPEWCESLLKGQLSGMDWDPDEPQCLWAISLNRPASTQIVKSVPVTKADAARRVFDIDGSGIVWGIIDSGIDAQHSAFRKHTFAAGELSEAEQAFGPGIRKPENNTRIAATYDFTLLRHLLSQSEAILEEDTKRTELLNQLAESMLGRSADPTGKALSKRTIGELLREVERSLKNGRTLDWSSLGPLLRVPHSPEYVPPENQHGTHVSGILGADWIQKKKGNVSRKAVGMCPRIEFYDLRVFGKDGTGHEFSILAALQFVRWLNAQHDHPVIHGVNLSLSVPHKFAQFACGRTPICDECDRASAEGVSVVVAAGNQGQAIYTHDDGVRKGYLTVSITDPGNAESVITVGSTHRSRPHTYGVSYFSSRGPTGDGRRKPDILAPGEKINSTAPGNKLVRSDGTSMAAPHVSGAAALLMCKHRELIGDPRRVKQILCETATDLGREPDFQGHGLVDTLRALQKI